MICKECQMENIDGALVCEECGVRLDDMEGSLQVQPLVFTTADGTKLDIPAKDEVVIGREDPVSEVFPDLDLTSLDGMENGVSRRHAIIRRSGTEYTIEDLDSINGTYINKKRIQSRVLQTVEPGDEIKFGKLTLLVEAA